MSSNTQKHFEFLIENIFRHTLYGAFRYYTQRKLTEKLKLKKRRGIRGVKKLAQNHIITWNKLRKESKKEKALDSLKYENI